MIASWKESAKRSLISSQMGAPVHIEVPKSKRTTPRIQVRNCFQTGWSRPMRARSLSRISWETAPRSPEYRSSTTSPGMTRMSMNVTSATPNSVGSISRKHLSRYLYTLLAQPHRIELVVQVVAGGDRPAPHLGQVRDDAVPLQRVDDVDLLVEQALLELPEDLLALLGVGRPALAAEEVVDDGVLVLAVVGVGGAEEARKVQVGLHDEAALEVHGDVEVTALEHRVIGRRLDHLHLHVQADLPPLIDEPDAQVLVGVRDAAVLEREGKAVGNAGLLQQALGLGPVLCDVTPVTGQ